MVAEELEDPLLPLSVSAEATANANHIIDKASSEHGLAIVVGITDGSLVKALIRESSYQVVAIDSDIQRVNELRHQLHAAAIHGERAAAIHAEWDDLPLPPYVTSLLTSERDDVDCTSYLQTLRPFGGIAIVNKPDSQRIRSLKPGNFQVESNAERTIVRRVSLPGSTDYAADWSVSKDELVRFPLGVLWFDDALSHFKRSPQPKFTRGVMISRPKDWQAPREKGNHKIDYPLLPPVLSDIYTGRVLDDSELPDLRATLKATSPSVAEPSQYRPPRQKDAWKPDKPVVGTRINPLTGEEEPRAFPKTYGCDGGVDYGDLYTLRSGTAAFYDKTCESGTVFLSGPRSGCTNSIIPSGGVLNVPYFYEGCTCSYPLPTAMSLVAMPESHEQWSSWGETEIKPKSIQRVGVNFGAPGDRITRDGTLWLDYPSVGGPSPKVRLTTAPKQAKTIYRHSVWIENDQPYPWVNASAIEGLESLKVEDLKPGKYHVRLYFAEVMGLSAGQRIQSITVQSKKSLDRFDIAQETGGLMNGIVREIDDVNIDGSFQIEFSASKGRSLISGVELIRQ